MTPPAPSLRALVAASLLVVLAALAPSAHAKKKLGAEKAASGLKEALSLGTGRAVDVLGVVDGYLKNNPVRIGVPDKLRFVEKGLRAVGQGELVDEFVLSMNRAAEAAAPLAKDVFLQAIKDMSFKDAVSIVNGGDHAATEYLEDSSRDRLFELFRPIVTTKLEEVGATQAFNQMIGRYATLPFADKPLFELDAHVTDGGLDGLFYMVAKEEERIRTQVVARTTKLLKEVFANRAGGSEASGSRKRWWERLGGG